MAGRTGTAAAAQREQFVMSGIADRFHHGKAGFRLDRRFLTFTRDHGQLWHDNPSSPYMLVFPARQIGRASCRERVCQYVSLSVAAVPLTKQTEYTTKLS